MKAQARRKLSLPQLAHRVAEVSTTDRADDGSIPPCKISCARGIYTTKRGHSQDRRPTWPGHRPKSLRRAPQLCT